LSRVHSYGSHYDPLLMARPPRPQAAARLFVPDLRRYDDSNQGQIDAQGDNSKK
jgi:hypothetical protein